MRGKYKLEVCGAKGGASIGTTQPAKSINCATTKGGFPDGGDTKTRNRESTTSVPGTGSGSTSIRMRNDSNYSWLIVAGGGGGANGCSFYTYQGGFGGWLSGGGCYIKGHSQDQGFGTQTGSTCGFCCATKGDPGIFGASGKYRSTSDSGRGGGGYMIEVNEKKQNSFVEDTLNESRIKLDELKKSINDQNSSSRKLENIEMIIEKVEILNRAIQDGATELINRSDFMELIKENMEMQENENDDLFDQSIVESEMKRRISADNENDGVIILLSAISNDHPEIGQRYPFLFKIINIMNYDLLFDRKEKHISIPCDESLLNDGLMARINDAFKENIVA